MLPSLGSDRRRITSEPRPNASSTSPRGRAAETKNRADVSSGRLERRDDEDVSDHHAGAEEDRHRVQGEAESLGSRRHCARELQQAGQDEWVEREEEDVGQRWGRHAARIDLVERRRQTPRSTARVRPRGATGAASGQAGPAPTG